MGTAKILIVDDELIMRESLAGWLARDGHSVDTAASGEEGLERFKQNRYDILLAEHFRRRFSQEINKTVDGLSREALDDLMLYEWPGNVRELENAIERAVVVGKGRKLRARDLPFYCETHLSTLPGVSLQEVEKAHILRILQDTGWNISESAGMLKIDRSTPILSELADRAPARAVKVLGITRVDLFIPILTHVYGEAQLGGRACIVSTHRLYPDAIAPTITSNERLIKESVHELGHTFKLRHCPDRACIMHYCRRIEDVDHKSNRFCRHCRVLIDDELKRAGLKEPI